MKEIFISKTFLHKKDKYKEYKLNKSTFNLKKLFFAEI